MKHAIISIEDRPLHQTAASTCAASAALLTRTSRPAGRPGASTNPAAVRELSLAAENKRTIFQKLREAALAYHLTPGGPGEILRQLT